MEMRLGHEVVGNGPRRIIVLNDWLCDTSTWQGARIYLDQTRFTWIFADLRGYGRSRGRTGRFDVLEAASDVLALADALGASQFSLVSHSMSTYVAMHLGQHAPGRLERIVLITPGPPRGFGANDAWLHDAQSNTRDDTQRARMIRARFAERLSPGWAEHKCRRWLETSDAEAAAAYIAMYARDGLPEPQVPIAVPVLALTGEEDSPIMRSAAVREQLAPLCKQFELEAFTQCGHYPMQELPPRTVAVVERFCGA